MNPMDIDENRMREAREENLENENYHRAPMFNPYLQTFSVNNVNDLSTAHLVAEHVLYLQNPNYHPLIHYPRQNIDNVYNEPTGAFQNVPSNEFQPRQPSFLENETYRDISDAEEESNENFYINKEMSETDDEMAIPSSSSEPFKEVGHEFENKLQALLEYHKKKSQEIEESAKLDYYHEPVKQASGIKRKLETDEEDEICKKRLMNKESTELVAELNPEISSSQANPEDPSSNYEGPCNSPDLSSSELDEEQLKDVASEVQNHTLDVFRGWSYRPA